MDNQSVILAFTMTLIAGLSTGLGSFIIFSKKSTNTSFLSFILGFSAGVMIYVAMVELFDDAKIILSESYGNKLGLIYTIISFFFGIIIIAVIDKCIPERENPHEIIKDKINEKSKENTGSQKRSGLYRAGIMTSIAIAIHNFPEGIATFMSAISSTYIAIPITIAIALHNIPEGMTVSTLIYSSTGSKKKAIIWSFLSGFSEFVGAVMAYVILGRFLNETVLAIILAGVAGIMVFISLDELLPAAEKYEKHHYAIYGVVVGMMVMAVSIVMAI